jgi:AcrR family transcriptional regulator
VSEGQEPTTAGRAATPSATVEGASERTRPRPGSKLPAGHHEFSRDYVVRSQRERMLDAIARAVAEKGYEKTSVADVVARAGVSRKTFYEQFADKEACFLAAYETIFGELAAHSLEAYRSRRRWPDRISAGLGAFLEGLAVEPAYARAGIVEVLAAGPRAIELRDALLRGFHTFFDPRRPEVPDHGAPRIVAEATVGGIYEVVYRHIVAEDPEDLRTLLPQLAYLALVPFVGSRVAARAGGLSLPTARSRRPA